MYKATPFIGESITACPPIDTKPAFNKYSSWAYEFRRWVSERYSRFQVWWDEVDEQPDGVDPFDQPLFQRVPKYNRAADEQTLELC
ncbi:hypothetical protein PV433_10740 [Paenibacillus sp. GYB004]|uniref:hypothetical protein n=1 Tax=Paenibacillus sp. GYB004 TaxID=2994393 RepID=UPI002F960CB4